MKKDDREFMEILEAFDLMGGAHSAAELVGVIRRQYGIGLHDGIGVCRWPGSCGGRG